MRDRYILFDFDGVIADSFSATFGTAHMHCNQISQDTYRSYFEGNIYEAKVDLVSGDHSTCRHDMDWWGEFTDRFGKEATLFTGMAETIRDLASAYFLIIVSSSIESPMQSFLAKYKLDSYFEAVMDHTVHKSKVEKIRIVFDRFGTSADKCLFITDTLGDVREAKKAGIGCVAVSWGVHSHETLQKGEPFCIVDSPHELPPAVEQYFANLHVAAR